MARRQRQWQGFGDWLVRERESRNWSQDTAVKELKTLTGNQVTRNWLSQIENGSKPSEDLMRDFERLYGEFRAAASSEDGGLAAAVRDQTEALRIHAEGIGQLAAAVAALAERVVPSAAPIATAAATGNPWPVIIRLALAARSMSPGALAVRAGTNSRSVERWLSGEGTPSLKEQRGIFTVLAESAEASVPARRRRTA